MKDRIFAYLTTVGIVFSAITGGAAAAEDLDGKRAICKFSSPLGPGEIELFLRFSKDQVTTLRILTKLARDDNYEFGYTKVEMQESVENIHVKPNSIIWGSFFGKSEPLTSRPVLFSRDDIGNWIYIERNSLIAESGTVVSGRRFTQPGQCEISDEAEEAKFIEKYNELKRDAEDEYREKLEEAKSTPPKL